MGRDPHPITHDLVMSRWDLLGPQLDMTRSCVIGWGSALTYFRSVPPEVGQCRPSLHQNCWRLAKKGKLPAVCWKSLTSGWSVFLEKIKKSNFLSSWALPGALNPRKRIYSFLEFFGLVIQIEIFFCKLPSLSWKYNFNTPLPPSFLYVSIGYIHIQ